MMATVHSGEALPSYDTLITTDTNPEIVQPTTLHIASRFIHSSDQHAPPLYEFSHSLGFLRDTDRKVEMSRLDNVVRNTGGIPAITTRSRILFDLAHRTAAEMPVFPFQAEAKSRRITLGSLGIEKVHRLTRKSGYRICRAQYRSGRLVAAEEPSPLFIAMPPTGEGGGVLWEWSDESGNILAREVLNGELLNLVVTAEMSTSMRDALVAGWIMRLWWELAEGKQPLDPATRKHSAWLLSAR